MEEEPFYTTPIGETTKKLKQGAKDLNIPIIALHQLNRETEKGGKPKLSNLQDSAKIEQDADTVLFLHEYSERPEGLPVDFTSSRENDYLGIIVAKRRGGFLGEEIVHRNKPCMRFENISIASEFYNYDQNPVQNIESPKPMPMPRGDLSNEVPF